MKNASEYRALASLCRQQAAYTPHLSWQLLGQAERWEHLAADAISDHFAACNTAVSGDLTKSSNVPGDSSRCTLARAMMPGRQHVEEYGRRRVAAGGLA